MDRCKTHNLFMGKKGCKQCNANKEQLQTAIISLTRNEEDIAINLIAGHSIIASIFDNLAKIPEHRRKELQPLSDEIYRISEQIDNLDIQVSQQMLNIIGKDKHNDMIVEVIKLVDIASGKVKNCKYCITGLDHKKKVRKDIENGCYEVEG